MGNFKQNYPMKNICKRYIVKGTKDYSILVDIKQTIIQCSPHSDKLLYKDFSELFNKYRTIIEFVYVGDEPYPMVVEEDVLEVFLEKNADMNYLIEKFNLKI